MHDSRVLLLEAELISPRDVFVTYFCTFHSVLGGVAMKPLDDRVARKELA
jgi:hypothetical protein